MRITELARRVARDEWIERRLFEIVGAWALDEQDGDVVRVFAAEARHHGWRAGMWAELAPVLHDVDDKALTPPAPVIDAFDTLATVSSTVERVAALADVVLPDVIGTYEAASERADPVADAPVIRALQLLILDTKQDRGAAARLRRSVVRTEEDSERAAATQSWLKVLLPPCWEV